jgi:hypothetical protein
MIAPTFVWLKVQKQARPVRLSPFQVVIKSVSEVECLKIKEKRQSTNKLLKVFHWRLIHSNDDFLFKGAFTLARFRARFHTKLAHLEMKFFLFILQNVQA